MGSMSAAAGVKVKVGSGDGVSVGMRLGFAEGVKGSGVAVAAVGDGWTTEVVAVGATGCGRQEAAKASKASSMNQRPRNLYFFI